MNKKVKAVSLTTVGTLMTAGTVMLGAPLAAFAHGGHEHNPGCGIEVTLVSAELNDYDDYKAEKLTYSFKNVSGKSTEEAAKLLDPATGNPYMTSGGDTIFNRPKDGDQIIDKNETRAWEFYRPLSDAEKKANKADHSKPLSIRFFGAGSQACPAPFAQDPAPTPATTGGTQLDVTYFTDDKTNNKLDTDGDVLRDGTIYVRDSANQWWVVNSGADKLYHLKGLAAGAAEVYLPVKNKKTSAVAKRELVFNTADLTRLDEDNLAPQTSAKAYDSASNAITDTTIAGGISAVKATVNVSADKPASLVIGSSRVTEIAHVLNGADSVQDAADIQFFDGADAVPAGWSAFQKSFVGLNTAGNFKDGSHFFLSNDKTGVKITPKDGFDIKTVRAFAGNASNLLDFMKNGDTYTLNSRERLASQGVVTWEVEVEKKTAETPKADPSSPKSETPADVRKVEITNPRSEVRLNDETYGPVQILTYDFKNVGTVATKTAEMVAPNDKNFVDGEGQEMLSNCTSGFFPLSAKDDATCRFFRRLTDDELKAGKTLDQNIRFNLFGAHGTRTDLIDAPKAPVTEFQPAVSASKSETHEQTRAQQDKKDSAQPLPQQSAPEEKIFKLDKSSYAAGEAVNFMVGVFKPGAQVKITLHSDPYVVGVFTADKEGLVKGSFVPPAGFVGEHTLIADDGNGKTVEVKLSIGDKLASTGAEQNSLVGFAAMLLLASVSLFLRRKS